MKFQKLIKGIFNIKAHKARFGALEILKYIGPGLLVTIGFIDPGNWASDVAAGSKYGYTLLWIVTLSTILLIILQHNAAHLGIASGLCIAEASALYMKPWISGTILFTAMVAAVSTALAEILGAAIALQILFNLPLVIGSILISILTLILLFTNSYKKMERIIIGFVSIIGISLLFELGFVHVDWPKAIISWIKPSIPKGSMPVMMSVLGAVVMPHNLFLHSEIIQSRQWNLKDDRIIKSQLNYEFFDTLFSMVIGWAINSAIIIIAAATFFQNKIDVNELGQAQKMLTPLAGNSASILFAIALLFSGISSSITAGMAGGSIFSGIFGEHYNPKDSHTFIGIWITVIAALIIIFFIRNPFQGLIFSQMILSIQLPITIFTQIYLTSSGKVMGKFANVKSTNFLLIFIGSIVTAMNIMLLISFLHP